MDWKSTFAQDRLVAMANETASFLRRPVFIIATLGTLACLWVQGPFVYFWGVIVALTFVDDRHWWRPVLIGSVIILACVWWHRYEVFWTSKSGTTYIDRYYGWSGTQYYRRCWGKSYKWFSEGPIAGERRQHGRWKSVDWEPEFRATVTFYWYGEEVTEGEFHLRNR